MDSPDPGVGTARSAHAYRGSRGTQCPSTVSTSAGLGLLSREHPFLVLVSALWVPHTFWTLRQGSSSCLIQETGHLSEAFLKDTLRPQPREPLYGLGHAESVLIPRGPGEKVVPACPPPSPSTPCMLPQLPGWHHPSPAQTQEASTTRKATGSCLHLPPSLLPDPTGGVPLLFSALPRMDREA